MASTSDLDRSKPSEKGGAALLNLDSPALQDVSVTITARLGTLEMSLGALLALKRGSVITLDRQMNEPVELLLNDKVVARGTIVAVDDHFGVRIDEMVSSS